jgi:hypothetical protein
VAHDVPAPDLFLQPAADSWRAPRGVLADERLGRSAEVCELARVLCASSTQLCGEAVTLRFDAVELRRRSREMTEASQQRRQLPSAPSGQGMWAGGTRTA